MGGAHAANYKALEDRVRVKTVASRGADRAAKVAESVGAAPTTDLEGAVSDHEVDAVDICARLARRGQARVPREADRPDG